MFTDVPSFHVGPGDLSTGPHACTANALLVEHHLSSFPFSRKCPALGILNNEKQMNT